MRRITCLAVFFILALSSAWSQEKVYLWKDVHSMRNERSCFYYYAPAKDEDTHIAVIICHGGSYHHRSMGTEGRDVAAWFAERGYHAFVLKYRVAMDGYHHPAMIQDFQRTMQLVRENASEYGIENDRVGAIGFSAGGHLVTMAGAFGEESYLKPLGIETSVSLKPDFVIPVYPVVTMLEPYEHRWSRLSLLGRSADEDTRKKFSMECQITSAMPPVFLLACKDDATVDYHNSVLLDQALTDAGVEHQFVLRETGDHGFGMNYGWGDALYSWLKKLYH
ncbi:MAG: alpha/beta hydrolase [Spirochaetia bacterium]|nr:alpha/beta hydrolase [Spirochaetia bacterium]